MLQTLRLSGREIRELEPLMVSLFIRTRAQVLPWLRCPCVRYPCCLRKSPETARCCRNRPRNSSRRSWKSILGPEDRGSHALAIHGAGERIHQARGVCLPRSQRSGGTHEVIVPFWLVISEDMGVSVRSPMLTFRLLGSSIFRLVGSIEQLSL